MLGEQDIKDCKFVSAHAKKGYRGRKGMAPPILSLGIRWR